MKIFKYVILIFVLASFYSCRDERVQFGKSSYYPSFLWVDDKQINAEKTFVFDFSQDAINDVNTFAEFAFVDSDGKIIGDNCFKAYIGDDKLQNNTFKILSSTDSVTIRFEFSPNADDGNYYGYLRLVNHSLDRIDSQELTDGLEVNVLQWSLYYEKKLNPLAKWLLIAIITILLCVFLWLVILRPIFYPHFGRFKKTVMVVQNNRTVFQSVVSFKGARKVIFHNVEEQQSLWSRIFLGRIKTVKCQYFTTKITVTPFKKDAIALGNNCVVTPNPFKKNGAAMIKDCSSNMIINLK